MLLLLVELQFPSVGVSRGLRCFLNNVPQIALRRTFKLHCNGIAIVIVDEAAVFRNAMMVTGSHVDVVLTRKIIAGIRHH